MYVCKCSCAPKPKADMLPLVMCNVYNCNNPLGVSSTICVKNISTLRLKCEVIFQMCKLRIEKEAAVWDCVIILVVMRDGSHQPLGAIIIIIDPAPDTAHRLNHHNTLSHPLSDMLLYFFLGKKLKKTWSKMAKNAF